MIKLVIFDWAGGARNAITDLGYEHNSEIKVNSKQEIYDIMDKFVERGLYAFLKKRPENGDYLLALDTMRFTQR